ncbi:MAG: nickel-dependent hydrogenase large subunit, partial [Rhodoferax sp.]|nr:nickel-dependent hydrogenase large subunit [Rhodoferax sp.]
MTRIVLGPFNRVEGDLEITLDVEAGYVRSARVSSPLFRGFEQLLVGRAPQDALVIVPRICGICSVAQSAAAAAALASLGGAEVPHNGRLASYLIQATENLADHLTHFYLFFMPDFARESYTNQGWHPQVRARFTALQGTAAPEVLRARSQFFQLMGYLAGRWPHSLALQPGGSTRAMASAERVRVLALLRGFRDFLETTLLGDRLERFGELHTEAQLRDWSAGRAGDFPWFLRLAFDLQLEQVGKSCDRFLSCGAYGLFQAGVWQTGQATEPLDTSLILEDTHCGWMLAGPPLPPAKGETVVDADKAQAYTWCKAPRYGGQIAETGALARQLVAGHPLSRA